VDVMLVGLQAGSNYGADYQAAFEGMYADLASEFDAPLFPGFFKGLLDAAGTQDQVREFMQRDGIHPNPEGVRVIVEAMGPSVAAFVDTLAD